MMYATAIAVVVIVILAGVVLMGPKGAPEPTPTPVPSTATPAVTQTPGTSACTTVADCPPGAARCVNGTCVSTDEHGCVTDGGYEWCAVKNKCIRPWEENCTLAVGSPGTGIPNPAAKYCTDMNYTLRNGSCVFPTSLTCEEWSFYQGECGKQFSLCEQNGNRLEARTEEAGTFFMKYSVCIFNDTSECNEQEYLAGRCRPSMCTKWNESVGGCQRGAVGVGVPNPAAKYCSDLNYVLIGEDCVFPDATRCEQWSFYRGNCGKGFSFCEQNGYTLQNRSDNMGTWTAEYAVCDFNGTSQCLEQSYLDESCMPGQCKTWSQVDGGCKN